MNDDMIDPGYSAQFKQRATDTRVAWTTPEVKAWLSQCPPASSIEPRANFAQSAGYVLEKLPSDRATRVVELKRRLQEQQSELQARRRRYEEIRTQGAYAFSDYDLNIAYQGLQPLVALRQSLSLAIAHVSYALSAIDVIQGELERDDTQLPLF